MTPEEGMKGKFAASMPEDDRLTLKLLLDWIKESETWRCAARAKETLSAAVDAKLGELVAKDILVTGGLKVEDGSPQASTPG